jgi:hypothetical protein
MFFLGWQRPRQDCFRFDACALPVAHVRDNLEGCHGHDARTRCEQESFLLMSLRMLEYGREVGSAVASAPVLQTS